MEKENKKIWLIFPKEKIQEPIIYKLTQKFDIITNIRYASVSEEVGILSMEITGYRNDIKKAIKWLEKLKIKVEPVEMNIITG